MTIRTTRITWTSVTRPVGILNWTPEVETLGFVVRDDNREAGRRVLAQFLVEDYNDIDDARLAALQYADYAKLSQKQ